MIKSKSKKEKLDFTHLHVHSEYSLLDGLPRIKNLIEYTKELDMKSIALTDHGAMYGAIEFYKQCLKNDIKPIIGCELYFSPGSVKNKTAENRQNYHLLFLAKNIVGYKNLMKLISIAHTEGFYYKPRIDWEILTKYKEGLICSTACIEGEIPSLILENKFERALKRAAEFRDLFGDDFYLEIQRHPGLENQEKANEGVIKISRKLGIPLIATNDSHYLKKEDAFAQDVLLMINTQTTINSKNRLSMIDIPDFYLKTKEEMIELFADLPDAIENTIKISEKCDLELELGKWYFPKLNLEKGKTAEETLREKTEKLAKEIYGTPLKKEIRERINYELEIICSKGYAPYFLIVNDFIEWANSHDTIVNTRGSAAGSLVSFVLGITSVDPLKYQIPFERFLNKDRPSPPDIDLDVSDDKRQQLLSYITEKYGVENVAQICTFGRMMAKAAIRDTARVLGYSYSTGDRISKMIPFGSQGFPMSIEKALTLNPELKMAYDNEPDTKKIIDAAKQIEGCARHISVHACGIVIAPSKLDEFCPIQMETNGDKIITQYEMRAIEDIGLIKFDILGIDYLSILGNAIVKVRNIRNKEIDLRKIPLDDIATFKMLSEGRTMGVFQLGGEGMTKWLLELKPERVEDLMAMVALYRPGPMAVIPEYIARKKDPQKIKYFDERIKPFLEKSYGLLIYQDDCLYTAVHLAGYNWVEADKFRKAIGKKIPAEMKEQKEKFIEGCIKNGVSKKKAEEIFSLIEPFVGYGFNKAHAASYGMLAYRTAYVKANYPVEYMCAYLSAEADNLEKVAAGIEECRKMGIIVNPPDINLSKEGFEIEPNENSLDKMAIRFGLGAIKNVGEVAIAEILRIRNEKGPYTSLSDFCLKLDNRKVNKKVLESLIKAGAFDSFGKRSSLLASLDKIREICEKKQKEFSNGQTNLFFQEEKQEKIEDQLEDLEEFSREELLKLEKEMIGIYITENPIAEKILPIKNIVSHRLSQLKEINEGKVRVGGVISRLRTVITKNGNKEMAFLTIDDSSAQLEVVIFPKVYEKCKKFLQLEKVILVEGILENKGEGEKTSLISESIVEAEEKTTINSIRQKKEFVFQIDIPKGTTQQMLVKLNFLLKKNPGKDRGVILFPSGKKVEIPFGINWSQKLEIKIKKMLLKP